VTSSVSGKRSPAELIAPGYNWRWRRESNPCARLCRPLPHHSATPPLGLIPMHLRADDGIRTRDPHLGKVMRYQLRYIRVPRARTSPVAMHDDSPRTQAGTNPLLAMAGRGVRTRGPPRARTSIRGRHRGSTAYRTAPRPAPRGDLHGPGRTAGQAPRPARCRRRRRPWPAAQVQGEPMSASGDVNPARPASAGGTSLTTADRQHGRGSRDTAREVPAGYLEGGIAYPVDSGQGALAC
jgi:hypothetical protein